MAYLYEIQTGNRVEVDDSAVRDYIISGKFGFHPSKPVVIKDSSGQVVSVPPGEAPSALLRGGSYYTRAESEQARLQEKYGGPLGAISAAGLGAASGLSLGISDIAAQKAGLPVEELRAAQPGPYIGGEVVGAIAPALATGGESLLARGLLATPAGVVGRVGAGAGGLTKAALGPGGGLARAGAPSAVAGATEGAIWFGAGQAKEDILEGKDVSIERVLPAMGLGALTGGIGTGLLSSAGYLAKQAVDKASPIVERFGKDFGKLPGPTKKEIGLEDLLSKMRDEIGGPESAVSSVLGKLGQPGKAEAAKTLLSMTPEGAAMRALAHTPDKDLSKGFVSYARQFDDWTKLADSTSLAISNEVKPARIAASLADVPTSVAYEGADEILSSVKALSKELSSLSGKAKYGRGEGSSRIMDAVAAFEERVGYRRASGKLVPAAKRVPKSSYEVFSAADQLQRDIKAVTKFGRDVTQAPIAHKARELYGQINSMLKNEGRWGKAAVDLMETDLAIHNYLTAIGKVRKDSWFGKTVNGKTRINPSRVKSHFTNLNEPANQLRADDFNDLLESVKSMAEIAKSRKLQDESSRLYSETSKMVDLSRAVGNLDKLSGTTDQAISNLANAMWRKTQSGFGAGSAGLAGFMLGGPLGAAAGAGASVLAKPSQAATFLHVLEKASRNSEGARKFAASSIAKLKTFSGGLEKIKKAVAPTAYEVFKSVQLTDRKHDKVSNVAEAVQQQMYDVEGLGRDLQKTQDKIDERLRPLADLGLHNVSTQLRDKELQRITLLYDTMPKRRSEGVMGKPLAPSSTEISQWARVFEASSNPYIVFTKVAQGTLSPVEVRVVRELYPTEYAAMKTDVIAAIRQGAVEFTYQEKTQLSMLFGEPLDGTLEPSFVLAMQQSYQKNGEEGSPSEPMRLPKRAVNFSERATPESQQTGA